MNPAAREALIAEFKDPEARRDYADSFLDSAIALQIKALRLQRKWSQKELAERAGMKQSRISAMERADYSRWSLSTLRRLAYAFDLALEVHFESFGTFLDNTLSLTQERQERCSFSDDPVFMEDSTLQPLSTTTSRVFTAPTVDFSDWLEAHGRRVAAVPAPAGPPSLSPRAYQHG